MQLAVIGLGNLGSAVAWTLAQNGHQVLAWEYDQAVVNDINQQQSNTRYLPGFTFPKAVRAVSDLADLCSAELELIFITLPSAFIEPVLAKVSFPQTIPLVNMSKGIDEHSHETVVQKLKRLFPQHVIAQLSGPSLANEFVQAVPTGFVAACDEQWVCQKISQAITRNNISVRCSKDIIGVELGGVLKNCYALGLGIVDGSDRAGLNFKGAFLTLALKEMTLLAKALGANESSLQDIAGMGDLIATALSDDSHNRKMGSLVAQGFSLPEIKQQMGVLAEGYNSLAAILPLAEHHNIDMPLATLIKHLILKDITLENFYDGFTLLLKSPEN